MCKKVCKKFFYTHNVCIFVESYEQKYIFKMKLSQIIIEKLLNDKNFRLNTAIVLDVTERNVQILADKNSVNSNLTKIAAINYYKSQGFTDDQIFEPIEVSHSTASAN